MPIGVVENALPDDADLLPWHFCLKFVRTNTWLVQSNEYRNGESQVVTPVTNSRKFWQLDLRQVMEHIEELRDFYLAHQGPVIPFYFYDVTETPNFTYDVTGDSAVGKHVVRFDGPWDLSTGVGVLRGSTTIRLVETA